MSLPGRRDLKPPQPRCPSCRWHLRFAPYDVVYASKLNIWEGYCWNPSCAFASHGCVTDTRPVAPADVIMELAA